MEKKQRIGARPHYFRGQLLLEDDFLTEQDYHAAARRRHVLNLHGWGVGWGLDVTASGDRAIAVSPGYAVDRTGQEIELRESTVLDLSQEQPNAVLSVGLVYEEEAAGTGNEEQRSRNCYGLLRTSTEVADAAVLLATVALDGSGKLTPAAIDTGKRRVLPGMLHRGWIRMPFRPVAILPEKNKKNAQPPPVFMVGATRAQAENDGAGGTMAISLPPQASRVHRLRIAGEENAKGLTVQLWIGGWNPTDKKHAKRALVDQRIAPGTPYDATFDIGGADADIDQECATMSIEIRSEGSCFISLVAIEISYHSQTW